MKSRFLECMSKYRDYQTVVVVAHNMLMRQFVPNEKIDFCQVIECELEIQKEVYYRKEKKRHLYVKIVAIIPLNIWGVVPTVGLGLLCRRG